MFDAMFLDDSVDARKAWRLRMGLDGSVLDAVSYNLGRSKVFLEPFPAIGITSTFSPLKI